MTIEPEEAEQALAAIHQTTHQMRRALNAWGFAYHLLVWGTIWLIGFSVSQFASPSVVGGFWISLDVVGAALSWYLGVKMGRNFHSPYGARLGLFWLALVIFGLVGMWFVHPTTPQEGALVLIMYVMLGWVVMGLWIQPRLAWQGLFVTALALLGYAFVPGYFFILMAVLGGGSMLGTGLYILRNWK